jgi:hypothetical protein
MMEALSTVAKLGGFQALSRLPEEWAKPVFEKLFTYKPGVTRGLFKGEKPELMVPEPKAIPTVPKGEEGLLTSTEQYTPPPSELIHKRQYFPKGMAAPLIEPETEQEIRTKMAALGASEEEINDAIQEKMLGAPKGVEARRERMIDQAENWMETYRQSNPMAAPDAPLTALKKARPGLARTYEDYTTEKRAKGALLGAQEENIRGAKVAREAETARKGAVEKRLTQKDQWYQSYMERKLKLQEQNKGIAAKAKSADQALKDANSAYRVYVESQDKERAAYNKMEIAFQKADPTHLMSKFDEPALSFDQWLRTEGFMFYERILALQGAEGGGVKAGGVTPPPTPRGREGAPQERRSKMIDFLNKGGAPHTPQPTQGE